MNRRNCLKTLAAGAASLWGDTSGRLLAQSTRTATPPLDSSQAMRELAQHRIVRIEARPMQDRYPRVVGPNSHDEKPKGRGGSFQIRIVTTDQGAVGWSMCHLKDEEIKPFIGRRVVDLFDIANGTRDEAMGLDRVLHDLAGNILQVPVARLIGRRGASATLVYSGAIYFDDLLPLDKPRGIDGVLESCRQDHEAGYRAFKLKIGRGFRWMPRQEGLRRDIEVTHAVRDRFRECKVLVDANNAYTVDEAIEFIRATADCDLYWIEELFEENRDGLKRLRDAMHKANCKALVAEGEYRTERAPSPTRYGGYTEQFVDKLYALAAEKLVDVFLMDLDTVGFSRWRRIMPELTKAGVQASPHLWAWTPRPYYTAHLAAGVGNIPIIEGIPGEADGIDYSAYAIRDGKLVLPHSPGFGLRLKG